VSEQAVPDPPEPPAPRKTIEPDHIYVGMRGAEWVLAFVAGIMVVFVVLALMGALR
jgi:hypothetical protein